MAPTAYSSYVLDPRYNTDITMDPKMSVVMRFQVFI